MWEEGFDGDCAAALFDAEMGPTTHASKQINGSARSMRRVLRGNPLHSTSIRVPAVTKCAASIHRGFFSAVDVVFQRFRVGLRLRSILQSPSDDSRSTV